MPKYLLKNNYFTPWGRFRRDRDGTVIPQHVVDEFGVPSTAIEVPDDYQETESQKRLMPHEQLEREDMLRQAAEAEARARAEADADAEIAEKARQAKAAAAAEDETEAPRKSASKKG